MKKSDGGNLAAGDVILLANNLCDTMFKQISVRLNGTLMGPQNNTYHQQAYIETCLHHDKDDGKDLLAPQGWYTCLQVPDDAAANEFTANMLNPAHDDYKALSQDFKNVVDARVKFLGGNEISLRFTPKLELFRLGKFLRPGVRIQIEMFLNHPNVWTIRHDGAITLRLNPADISVSLYLYRLRLLPSIYRELTQQAISGKVMTYPVVRGDMRTYSHPNNVRYLEINNPFQGVIPNRFVVVLLKQAAFDRDIGHNPFGYELFNLASAKLQIGSEEYPYETLELNHDNGNKDLVGYHRFLQASGAFGRGRGNMVQPEDWGHGKRACFLVFDTTANQALVSPVLNPKQQGDARITLTFGANPGAALTVIVYGEFENIVEIDRNGSVIYDISK